ncbi:MAG: enoyl-CoA hydratase/isomerase family protein [Spirochaetes bacterium]|nr:enoyl-CoA hydratase/isomerase family protein [Spirochaetota bacterium]
MKEDTPPLEALDYEIPEKGIGVLSLNRPTKYNAVNLRMLEELERFWARQKNEPDSNVLILRGNGEKGFCGGLDLTSLAEASPTITADLFYRFQARLSRVLLAMRQAPQPIICAVHGAATGLGLSFTLASDVRIITTDARFSAAYINVGFGGADMGCSYFLPRIIGAGRAYEFMLTGGFMTAEEAMNLGMASRMVGREKLLDTAMAVAKTMNSKNPMGLKMTKEAINVNLDAGGLEQALQVEDRNQTLLFARGMLNARQQGSG